MIVLQILDQEELILHEPFLFHNMKDAINEIKKDLKDHNDLDDSDDLDKEINESIKIYGYFTYDSDVYYYINDVEPE